MGHQENGLRGPCFCGHAPEEHTPRCTGEVEALDRPGVMEPCGCIHYEEDDA